MVNVYLPTLSSATCPDFRELEIINILNINELFLSSVQTEVSNQAYSLRINYLLVSSAGKHCKQFGHKSGPTK